MKFRIKYMHQALTDLENMQTNFDFLNRYDKCQRIGGINSVHILS